jgi:hypothetical protein
LDARGLRQSADRTEKERLQANLRFFCSK